MPTNKLRQLLKRGVTGFKNEIASLRDLIQHVNKVSLAPNAPDPVAAPPVVRGVNPRSLKQGSAGTVTISGSNFRGARVTPVGPTGITVDPKSVTVAPNGQVITADIAISHTVMPGIYSIMVTTLTPNGRDETPFEVTPENIMVDLKVKYEKKPKEVPHEEQHIKIKIMGRFLHRSRIVVVGGPANGLAVEGVTPSPDGTKITATVRIAVGTRAGTHRLEVRDPNNPTGPKRQVEFKILPSLTPYEKLSLVISSLSLVISFIGTLSLIFIYLQTALTTATMQASMQETISTLTLEMDKIFIEKPELRPYFYDGIDIQDDDKNYNLVVAVAEYQLDYFDSVWAQFDYLPKDKDAKEDWDAWEQYFADSFANSPILCKRLKRNEDWYMQRLVAISQEKCKPTPHPEGSKDDRNTSPEEPEHGSP